MSDANQCVLEHNLKSYVNIYNRYVNRFKNRETLLGNIITNLPQSIIKTYLTSIVPETVKYSNLHPNQGTAKYPLIAQACFDSNEVNRKAAKRMLCLMLIKLLKLSDYKDDRYGIQLTNLPLINLPESRISHNKIFDKKCWCSIYTGNFDTTPELTQEEVSANLTGVNI